MFTVPPRVIFQVDGHSTALGTEPLSVSLSAASIPLSDDEHEHDEQEDLSVSLEQQTWGDLVSDVRKTACMVHPNVKYCVVYSTRLTDVVLFVRVMTAHSPQCLCAHPLPSMILIVVALVHPDILYQVDQNHLTAVH